MGQDDFQLYQDRIKTETKATGGNETDARTGGDFKFSQDDFQMHQDGNKTKRTGEDFELYQDNFQLYQDGQDRFKHYQDEILTETKAMGGIESDARTGGYFRHGHHYFQL